MHIQYVLSGSPNGTNIVVLYAADARRCMMPATDVVQHNVGFLRDIIGSYYCQIGGQGPGS